MLCNPFPLQLALWLPPLLRKRDGSRRLALASRHGAAWGKGISAGGSDTLLGVRREDLGREPTALEEEIFKHAADVSQDSTVMTAYFPPVSRSHSSVHPNYARKRSKRDKPVSWMYCMTVRRVFLWVANDTRHVFIPMRNVVWAPFPCSCVLCFLTDRSPRASGSPGTLAVRFVVFSLLRPRSQQLAQGLTCTVLQASLLQLL